MKTGTKRQAGTRRAKIFIVEDHPITRHGLVQLINQEQDMTVCGEADNARDALTGIQTKHPDLALADITNIRQKWIGIIKRPGGCANWNTGSRIVDA